MAKPVLIAFCADWCGPCRMQTRILEALKEEYGDKVEIKKFNIDKERDLTCEYGVFVVPTLILEKDGVELIKWMGVTSKEEIAKAIEKDYEGSYVLPTFCRWWHKRKTPP
jgi:thioredoxin 1